MIDKRQRERQGGDLGPSPAESLCPETRPAVSWASGVTELIGLRSDRDFTRLSA